MPLRGTLVLLTALFLSAPLHAQTTRDSAAAVAAAQTAARSWLDLVDHGKYDVSWDSAAAEFKSNVSKQAWAAAVSQTRGPLDPFTGRRVVSATFTTKLPKAPPGRYVVIRYETKVRGGDIVAETVTPMQESDGTWRVSGYYVRPR
jgi:hypothetical protein